MMIKGGENCAVNFDFRWQRVPRFKNTVDPLWHYTNSFNRKCKFA